MGKTLGEIIEAVRDGERPDYEDLRYAIRAMDSNEARERAMELLSNAKHTGKGDDWMEAALALEEALSQQPGVVEREFALRSALINLIAAGKKLRNSIVETRGVGGMDAHDFAISDAELVLAPAPQPGKEG